jgi:hypothetical protein
VPAVGHESEPIARRGTLLFVRDRSSAIHAHVTTAQRGRFTLLPRRASRRLGRMADRDGGSERPDPSSVVPSGLAPTSLAALSLVASDPASTEVVLPHPQANNVHAIQFLQPGHLTIVSDEPARGAKKKCKRVRATEGSNLTDHVLDA